MKIGGVMGPEKKKNVFFLYINQLIFKILLFFFFNTEIFFFKMSKHIDFSTLNLYLRCDSYFFQYFFNENSKWRPKI